MKQCYLDERSEEERGPRFGKDVVERWKWASETGGTGEIGIQSVHAAPFSHVSRITRHGA